MVMRVLSTEAYEMVRLEVGLASGVALTLVGRHFSQGHAK